MTREFLSAAERLDDGGMGTRDVGPLLYSMARMTRPVTVVEAGAGYTTLFLLKAASDNASDFARESAALRAKTWAYQRERDAVLGGDDDGAVVERCADLYDDWARAQPALANPEHYERPFDPVVYCIDDGATDSSLEETVAIAGELGLGGYLRVMRGDLRGGSAGIEAARRPIDLAWLDAGGHAEYSAFVEEYWPLLSPRGGLMLLHYTLNNPYLSHVVKDIQLRRAAGAMSCEVLSVLEPHRFRQSSVSMVRRTDGWRDDFDVAERIARRLNADLLPASTQAWG